MVGLRALLGLNLVATAQGSFILAMDLAPRQLKLFREYDLEIIVPMHGFDSVEHYYRCASSGPYLPKIALPSLVVHAKDDPMVPFASVEPWTHGASKQVSFAFSDHGGHIGWVGGVDEASWITGWSTRTVLRFFEAHRQ